MTTPPRSDAGAEKRLTNVQSLSAAITLAASAMWVISLAGTILDRIPAATSPILIVSSASVTLGGAAVWLVSSIILMSRYDRRTRFSLRTMVLFNMAAASAAALFIKLRRGNEIPWQPFNMIQFWLMIAFAGAMIWSLVADKRRTAPEGEGASPPDGDLEVVDEEA